MTDEKQGEVNEPDEIAAEDSVGAQETPTERQHEREQKIVDEPVAESEQRIADAAAPASAPPEGPEEDEEFAEAAPRVKPEIPGMDLEVDIVREGEEAFREEDEDEYGEGEGESAEEEFAQPIADAAIDLAAGARYTATGKRKTAVARVILKPGAGAYLINGRTLDVFFPRPALQRTIRTALETVGLEEKIDVVAKMHGGGVSAQAGALRHAISKALVDADPNLRSELKRRGFLTRDARVKERKKAGLKKARKRPQFSKR
ncbi:MAG TPA: 30S ribosomal protein S9 [Solirubrobacteraceae bacterium]|nr:30S ribosomal protein S9 [Solirubrobacteraceae bacterium]